MNKFIFMISLSVSLALIGLRFYPIREPKGYSRFNLDPAELARKEKNLDAQIYARFALLDIQDGIHQKLARGELTLARACDQLYASAREVYPRRLVHLRRESGNMPLKVKMASNMADHFRFEAEDTPSFLKVVARLEQEMNSKSFRDWCRQPWAQEPEP